VAAPHKGKILTESFVKTKDRVEKTPFGLGGRLAARSMKNKAQPYIMPHNKSGLKLEEDFHDLSNSQIKAILKDFRKPSSDPTVTETIVNQLVRKYQK
jgi:hypothetical protein